MSKRSEEDETRVRRLERRLELNRGILLDDKIPPYDLESDQAPSAQMEMHQLSALSELFELGRFGNLAAQAALLRFASTSDDWIKGYIDVHLNLEEPATWELLLLYVLLYDEDPMYSIDARAHLERLGHLPIT